MSTLNGFGTLFYGWRHQPDGTATATRWLAAWWLPLVPLYRQRLRVLTDFGADARNTRAEAGGLVLSLTDRYEVIERLPLSAREVAITYFKTLVGVPALLLGPLLLIALAMKLAQWMGIEVAPQTPAFTVYMIAFAAALLNFLWQLVRIIRRTRGWQPRLESMR